MWALSLHSPSLLAIGCERYAHCYDALVADNALEQADHALEAGWGDDPLITTVTMTMWTAAE